MSTQSPNPPTPKGSRARGRNPKKNTTPLPQKTALLSTPPSSPPRNLSPGGTATDSSVNVKSSKKKSARGKKPSPAPNSGHRHTSSHPNAKDGSHYAGPTFHASPAPSALPMPSFFSNSVPESDLEPTLELDDDSTETDPDVETTPSKPKSRAPINERQSTPLDFLFKAAVEAKNPNMQRGSEPDAKTRSPQTDSKVQRHQKGMTDGMFPFEMENHDTHPGIGPSFAPSYKDRMDALRSSSSPSQAPTDLDEEQRKAKTDALKNLLLNPRPQRPPASTHMTYDQASTRQRPSAGPNVPHFATPLRTTSGPPASTSYGVRHEQKQPMAGNGIRSHSPYKQTNGHQPPPQQSGLRQELSSPRAGNMASQGRTSSPLAYNQSNPAVQRVQQMNGTPTSQPFSPHSMPARQSPQSVDTKKMEDDLRKVLKLDGMSSSGVQSSYA